MSKNDILKEVEIHTYDSIKYNKEPEEEIRMNMIRAPRMPQDLRDTLDTIERMQIL
jgi:hypothetical protein